MKKYTFEELVQNDSVTFEPYDNTRFLDVRDVILLLKQVRQATLEECACTARWYYEGDPDYLFHYADDIHVNRHQILDLDKDSIEVNE